MNTIPMTATEAIAECNQLLRRLDALPTPENPDNTDMVPITRRQRAAIAKLMDLAMPEALGHRARDPQRRHR